MEKYYLILMIIAMFSLIHYWHSANMEILFFTIGLSISIVLIYLLSFLFNKEGRDKIIKDMKRFATKIFFITGFFLIFTTLFSHLWQSTYLLKVVDQIDVTDFITKFFLKANADVAFPVKYVYNYKDTFFGITYFYSNILILFCSLLIFLLPLAFKIAYWRKRSIFDLPLILSICVVIAQGIFWISYYQANSINVFYGFFFFPLIGLYVFADLMHSQILDTDRLQKYLRISIYFLLAVMISCSFVCLVTINTSNHFNSRPLTLYEDTESSFLWLNTYKSQDYNVIVDFNIIGKYIQREVSLQKPTIEYIDLTPEMYMILVGESKEVPNSLKRNYIIIDWGNMKEGFPIQVTSSRATLVEKYNQINRGNNQDKIYQDNKIAVFVFT